MPRIPSALARTAAALGALACLAAIDATAAGATTFCVHTTSAQHCSGTQKADLQAALTAASTAPNNTHRNTVKVGDPGPPPPSGYTYNTPNPATNPVDVVGAGSNHTTLTFSGGSGSTVLGVNGDGSTVSNLKIVIPAAAGGTGLALVGGSASGILVTSPGPQSQSLGGITIVYPSTSPGPAQSLTKSSVLFPTTGSGSAQGVVAVVGAHVSDLSVRALGSGPGLIFVPPAAGRRTTSTARRISISEVPTSNAIGIGVVGQTVNADNVTIAMAGGTGSAVGAYVSAGGATPPTLNLNHLSAYGNLDTSGSPSSVGVLASGSSSQGATVNVRNSILVSFFYGTIRSASGSGTVNVRYDYSDYDRIHRTESGPGATTNGAGNIPDADDPLWVNPAAGDFRLLPGSPVINRGAPNALNPASESLVDILGHPRISGGRRDMGAVEFQFPPKFSLSGGRFDPKSGKVRLKARCRQPAGDRCRFDVKLKRKKTTLKLKGTAAGGRSTTLKAKLKGKALKSARKHKSVKFAASGKVTQIAGAVAKVSGHVKLKRGKVKH